MTSDPAVVIQRLVDASAEALERIGEDIASLEFSSMLTEARDALDRLPDLVHEVVGVFDGLAEPEPGAPPDDPAFELRSMLDQLPGAVRDLTRQIATVAGFDAGTTLPPDQPE